MADSKRIYGLDVLRATAILLVIFFHTNKLLSFHIDELIFYAAPDGVSIFFVLSGFLIGGIILKIINSSNAGFSDLKKFWLRRWFRTLPAYFFVLFALISHRIATNSAEGIASYLKYIFFLQNINHGEPYFFPESWSLSVEEWFYFLIPGLLFLYSKITGVEKKKIILFSIVLIILASVILRIVRIADLQIATYHDWNIYLRKPVITRMDSIMFGFLGAYMNFYYSLVWQKGNRLIWIGIGLLLLPSISYVIVGFNWTTAHLRLPVESIGTLCLLPRLSNLQIGKGFSYKFFTFISIISYSMYLLNYTPFNEWVLPRLIYVGVPNNHSLIADMFRLLAFLAWSICASYMLWRFVERPLMNIRDRLYK